MKKTHLLFLLILIVLVAVLLFVKTKSIAPEQADTVSGASYITQDGNSPFHQNKSTTLQSGKLRLSGEVFENENISLHDFHKRELVVKESVYDEQSGISFVGAYRYQGYSLFDLLHPVKLNKKNNIEFEALTDLYVIVENDKADFVVFSWAEIFYTNLPHQILIATEAASIGAHDESSVSGGAWKIVVANDLFSYRVLENPTNIIIKSFDKKSYPKKETTDLFSPQISVFSNGKLVFSINSDSDTLPHIKYSAGFSSNNDTHKEQGYLKGPLLGEILSLKISSESAEWIRKGLVCFAGIDGNRAIYSFSELFNRLDQVFPILAIPSNPKNGGYYQIFLPSDFNTDRVVRALSEIYLFMDA